MEKKIKINPGNENKPKLDLKTKNVEKDKKVNEKS